MQPAPSAELHARDLASLEELLHELAAHGYQAHLATPPGEPPRLDVRNPIAGALSDTIYAAHGWFWWSWAERITLTGDVPAAARKIAAVLHATPGPTHD